MLCCNPKAVGDGDGIDTVDLSGVEIAEEPACVATAAAACPPPVDPECGAPGAGVVRLNRAFAASATLSFDQSSLDLDDVNDYYPLTEILEVLKKYKFSFLPLFFLIFLFSSFFVLCFCQSEHDGDDEDNDSTPPPIPRRRFTDDFSNDELRSRRVDDNNNDERRGRLHSAVFLPKAAGQGVVRVAGLDWNAFLTKYNAMMGSGFRLADIETSVNTTAGVRFYDGIFEKVKKK